ncbi:MAG: outer membrane protein assembly factor BamD [Chlorobi bacterium]|nr:outer membrane protein assembly factor BamD [Chlorobiota bacterium]
MIRKYPRYITILFIVSLLFTGACSEYDKLLKSDDIELKYKAALEYYQQEKYTKAATLIEDVLPRYKGTTKSEELDYLHAKSYYEMGDYVMASHYFQTFVQTYVASEHADEADFFMGYCYYKLSPRPELDQSNTYNAINAFMLHKTKFPDSEYNSKCDSLITVLNDKLAEKSYLAAKLYFNMEQYKAAVVALGNSLEDFPETSFREELMFLRLKARYLYAQHSVHDKQPERYQDTIDEYYTFIDEFPKSKFGREAEKIYTSSTDFLTKK